MANNLKKIAQSQVADLMLKEVVKAGYNKVFLQEKKEDVGWAWYDEKKHVLVVGRNFLDNSNAFKSSADLPSEGLLTITHELAHGFDDAYKAKHGGFLSESKEFLDTIGFIKDGDNWKIRGRDETSYQKDWEEMRLASRSSDKNVVQKSFELNRKNGLKFGI